MNVPMTLAFFDMRSTPSMIAHDWKHLRSAASKSMAMAIVENSLRQFDDDTLRDMYDHARRSWRRALQRDSRELARRGVEVHRIGRARVISFPETGAFMADDKTKVGGQDRSRIAMGEDYEVAYWTKKFGVSKDELASTVAAVGSSAQAVADFLNKRL
jgi:hypothetical protein